MKIGSEAHKDLFCQSFMDSHLLYEPGVARTRQRHD